jgi:hypothetical protein
MTLRDQRQQEFAEAYLNRSTHYKKGGILYLCARFGKIRTACIIMQKRGFPKTLIGYPDKPVKDAWIQEFKDIGFDASNIHFSTHVSLEKVEGEWDLVILDEVHLLSERQRQATGKLQTKEILGLTGTMTENTEEDLRFDLDLQVIENGHYPIHQAIKEGVITDYEITVVKVPLDTKELIYTSKGKKITEKRLFDNVTWVLDNKADELDRLTVRNLRFKRMRIIQNSVAKLKATQWILKKSPEERILVFCGVTAIADQLGCPSYHNKSKEKHLFDAFASGEGNHMAVCKLGNTGVTYRPLNRVVVNYFDSNGENLAQKIQRCMAMEYNNLSKKSKITLISSNEPTELKWLWGALEFFDPEKVKYADIRELYPAQV